MQIRRKGWITKFDKTSGYGLIKDFNNQYIEIFAAKGHFFLKGDLVSFLIGIKEDRLVAFDVKQRNIRSFKMPIPEVEK